jgi:hypothetical protein
MPGSAITHCYDPGNTGLRQDTAAPFAALPPADLLILINGREVQLWADDLSF